MPSPRRRAVELIQRLDANGIEYLRTLIAELLATQDRAAALDDATTAVLEKPQTPE